MKKMLIGLIFIVVVMIILIFNNKKDKLIMPNFYNKNIKEVVEFTTKYNLDLEINEVFDDSIIKDNVTWQNIKSDEILKKDTKIVVSKSKGKNMEKQYKENNVDESGLIPVMMYHGIVNLKDSDTAYTGGNVDKDGYTRTAESFRKDLDYYYNEGYRMIRLEDYIDGKIDTEMGKSPIILTFDDGLENNIKVTGLDSNGNIIIDPNSAVGILEEYKKKYPDYNVTATFFINGGLFRQTEYNEKILNWLIDNGYDIGNHTYTHVDFTTVDKNKATEEVGKMYQKLDGIIKDKYVNIVALPFGSPYDDDHSNFKYIIEGTYNDYKYNTKSTLRVGWEANYSPFSKSFNPQFIKRIRAYDNNGENFDIKMNFNRLKETRYISDGDINTIVIPTEYRNYIKNDTNRQIIVY